MAVSLDTVVNLINKFLLLLVKVDTGIGGIYIQQYEDRWQAVQISALIVKVPML